MLRDCRVDRLYYSPWLPNHWGPTRKVASRRVRRSEGRTTGQRVKRTTISPNCNPKLNKAPTLHLKHKIFHPIANPSCYIGPILRWAQS